MSGDVLKKIKQAENEAAEMKRSAADKARDIADDAEKKGFALCEAAENEGEQLRQEESASAAQKADEITRSCRSEAADSIEAMKKAAELNMDKAAAIIIEGIVKQWR